MALGIYIYLGIFLWTIDKEKAFFEYSAIPIMLLLGAQLFLTHIFNINSFKTFFLKDDKYLFIKWIGVIQVNDRYEVLLFK